MRRSGGIAAVALTLLLPAPANAVLDEAGYRALNEAVIADYVLPHYEGLVEASAAFQAATGPVCEHPDPAGLSDLQREYGRLADAWQRVAPLRFGPVQLLMRAQRFSFWPDPKDAVGEAVDDRVSSLDFDTLIEEEIQQGSVAGQGLPALERLLFGEEAEAAFLAGDEAAQFRCAYVAGISDNLAYMAADLRHEWGDLQSGFAADLLAAGSDPGLPYRSQEEVALELFKTFHAAIEIVADHKLARPLGDSIDTAKPRLTEAWRSGRSLRNIRIGLEGAMQMYLLQGGFGDALGAGGADPALDPLLRKAFPQIMATLETIALPLDAAIVDPVQRPNVEKLALETRAMKALVEQRLAPALGLPVGFNSLDGD